MPQFRRPASKVRRCHRSILLAFAMGACLVHESSAQSPAVGPPVEPPVATKDAAAEGPAEVELQPPVNSTLEIRVARRPWLLEKLTGPKKEKSIKMNPPRPPAQIPDPPSMLRLNPDEISEDGWFRRRPDDKDWPAGSEQASTTEADSKSSDEVESLVPKTAPADAKPATPTPSYASGGSQNAETSDQESSQSNEQPEDSDDELEEVTVDTKAVEPPKATETPPKKSEVARPSAAKPQMRSSAPRPIQPQVELDYTGHPKQPIRLSRTVSRMQSSMRACLRYYYSRPEYANERSNWGMLHAIMVYGSDTKLLAGNRAYSSIAWIAGNNACRGQRLLSDEDGRITARSGVGLQGHQAQMLAIFSLCDVPLGYPLYAGDNRYTVKDLVRTEMQTCKRGEELTFTLIGLSHYLDTDAVWTNDAGEIWDFERLIREELAQPIVGAACGGTHRLMGFAHALRKRRAEGKPITGQWKRAELYTRDFVSYCYRLQNRDGSMTTDWFEGREDNGDIDRKIQTTGHMVEWLLTLTPDSQLQDRRLVNAIRFLLKSMYEERGHEWKIGPKGHALRSLAMYYERVYQAGPAWQTRAMAQSRPLYHY